MRVVHLITALNVGGAEAMLGRLVAHGARHWLDVETEVVSLMVAGTGAEPIRAAGVAVHDCGLRGTASLPGASIRLARHVSKARPDLIVAWMYHAQLAALGGRALARCGAPIVWNVRHSIHDLGAESTATRAILRANALLSRVPAAIIYNSAVAAKQYKALGYCAARTTVIPNGFDLSRFAPDQRARDRLGARFGIAPGALAVGLIARNHPMKDPATAANAVRIARESGADIHLLLVGDGMTRPSAKLSQALAALPTERVTLSEHQPGIAALLPGLDVVALSSAWGEGFPNILGEAMACGVPCIATDVGDSAAVVGDTGLIVARGDVPALAAGLMKLAAMPVADRRALGLRARSRIAEHFSLDSVGARYRRLFSEVARQPCGSVREVSAIPLAAE